MIYNQKSYTYIHLVYFNIPPCNGFVYFQCIQKISNNVFSWKRAYPRFSQILQIAVCDIKRWKKSMESETLGINPKTWGEGII